MQNSCCSRTVYSHMHRSFCRHVVRWHHGSFSRLLFQERFDVNPESCVLRIVWHDLEPQQTSQNLMTGSYFCQYRVTPKPKLLECHKLSRIHFPFEVFANLIWLRHWITLSDREVINVSCGDGVDPAEPTRRTV